MSGILTENTAKKIALPRNSNLINYSVLNEFYSPEPYRSFSIKYVVEGSELYSVNGNKYVVKDKQYLLANKHSEGFVEVDSKKSVTGICIDVAPHILSEVIASYLKPDAAIADLELDTFFNTPSFLENMYSAQHTHLGQYLLQLENMLIHKIASTSDFNKEFYYTLSEKIVEDHVPVIKQLQNVKAIKLETRKALYRKLLKARFYIADKFNTDLSIELVARDCGISEYHFFRLFKSAFGISPHQFLIAQRLNFAKQLIEKERPSMTTLAMETGFPDVASFSKSFKKQFGLSPSNYLPKK